MLFRSDLLAQIMLRSISRTFILLSKTLIIEIEELLPVTNPLESYPLLHLKHPHHHPIVTDDPLPAHNDPINQSQTLNKA